MDKQKPAPKKGARKPAVWERAFLSCLAKTGNVTKACKLAKIADRSSVYNARKAFPDFAAAWDDAKEQAADALEAEAHRRGVNGVKRPVYQGGELVGYTTEYSDTLLIFLMKGANPEKFRERYEVKHGGRVTTINLKNLSDGDLDTLEAILDRAAVPGPSAGGEGAPPPV
jgi:hypothetical protein